jgi:hypothetical protein
MKVVSFPIEDDPWHGYSSEALACQELDGVYRVSANPFFVRGVAKGDLIQCKQLDGRLEFEKLIEKSGNWTYRVIMARRNAFEDLESFLTEIYDYVDISEEITEHMMMFSLCVPPTAVRHVYKVLEKYLELDVLDFEEANLGTLLDSG